VRAAKESVPNANWLAKGAARNGRRTRRRCEGARASPRFGWPAPTLPRTLRIRRSEKMVAEPYSTNTMVAEPGAPPPRSPIGAGISRISAAFPREALRAQLALDVAPQRACEVVKFDTETLILPPFFFAPADRKLDFPDASVPKK